VLAIAIVIACVTVNRHPSTGSGEGKAFPEP
jgi:hypothetical protein